MLDPFQSFIVKLLGVAILAAAAGIAFRSTKGKMSQAANSTGIIVMAIVVAALGAVVYTSGTGLGQEILATFGLVDAPAAKAE